MAKETEDAEEVTHGGHLLDDIRDLQQRTEGTLERAQEAKELSVALQAISEARDNLELLAKLLDELDGRGDETN